MSDKLATIIVGFGKVAAGYSRDEKMNQHYQYATHAQVLRAHPAFAWDAAVDPSPEARAFAKEWGCTRIYESVDDIPANVTFDVAVLATPSNRLGIVRKLKGIKGVILEKPMAENYEEAESLVKECEDRNIVTQVNYWRRSDRFLRELAGGRLTQLVGKPQAVHVVYGNGLLNNGSHMIDLVRMLIGEISSFQINPGATWNQGPVAGDLNLLFSLEAGDRVPVAFHCVDFTQYRENSIEIFGTTGRLSIVNEGLINLHYSTGPNRGMTGVNELISDKPMQIESSVGDAFYRVYSDLANAILNGGSTASSGRSALATERVISGIFSLYSQSKVAEA
ncbi:MAG: Gfo/Idh/MocA family oxidoreductase [Leptospirales bacterium]|nr:Gfo/Idh/MocA family oxidoreductase [Leptospirales bacterium]